VQSRAFKVKVDDCHLLAQSGECYCEVGTDRALPSSAFEGLNS
jgi:hypothetical protein